MSEVLNEALISPGRPNEPVHKAVSAVQTTVQKLSVIVTTKILNQACPGQVRRRLWIRYRHDVQELHEELCEARANLHMALSIQALSVF